MSDPFSVACSVCGSAIGKRCPVPAVIAAHPTRILAASDAQRVRGETAKRGDIVYTPAWVVTDMLTHFRPTGVVLDPCRGDGAFTDQLPAGSPWCEIEEDRDFFYWTTRVDWVVGNPPYSVTREWFRHSYTIADHLLYLVPLRNVFSGYGFVREIYDYGGIVEIRVYGTGGRLGFPMGNAVGAMHVQAGYEGPLSLTFYDHQEVLGLVV